MVLRMRNVPFIDATGMHNFKEVLKTLKNYKVRIVLSGVQPNVREELLKSGIDRYIPLDMICPHYDIAKVKAVEILGDMEKHAGK